MKVVEPCHFRQGYSRPTAFCRWHIQNTAFSFFRQERSLHISVTFCVIPSPSRFNLRLTIPRYMWYNQGTYDREGWA